MVGYSSEYPPDVLLEAQRYTEFILAFFCMRVIVGGLDNLSADDVNK